MFLWKYVVPLCMQLDIKVIKTHAIILTWDIIFTYEYSLTARKRAVYKYVTICAHIDRNMYHCINLTSVSHTFTLTCLNLIL